MEVPRLDFDATYQEPPIDKVDSQGNSSIDVRVVVPVLGDTSLLPQHVQDAYLHATPTIEGRYLFLRYSARASNAHTIENYVRQDQDYLRNHWNVQLQSAVDQYHARLAETVRKEVTARKTNLQRTAESMMRTGLPLKRTSSAVTEIAIPTKRRRSAIEALQRDTTADIHEYYLPKEEYDYILSVLKRMVNVMERSPRTFARMKEPELRDILLVNLNGHYEHGATGETFNGNGKTDINLHYKDKATFIAECKIWKGEAELSKAIDQLLGYTTWRDLKVALLIFVRGRNPSTVLKKIMATVPTHQCFLRQDSQPDETQIGYVFHHPNDPDRHVTMTVIMFIVPAIDQETEDEA